MGGNSATYHVPPQASKQTARTLPMIRHLLTVSTGTLASRLLGFARDALTAALLGAGPVADAYLAAFQLITVVRRLVTEGALNAALVPSFLRVEAEQGARAAAAFAGRVLGTIGLLTIAAALLLGVLTPFALSLIAPGFDAPALATASRAARLMLPYIAFVGPVAVLMGLLNAKQRFAFAAFSPLLFNIALIAVLAFLLVRQPETETAALILAATIGIAGCLQLVALGTHGRRLASSIRPSFDAAMRRFLASAVPGAAASAMPQLLILAGVVVASSSSSAVSWLYFANRLIDLPLGLVGVAMGTVLMPELFHAAQNDDRGHWLRTQRHAVVMALALSLPATLGLMVLAEPVVFMLFQHGAFSAEDARATAGVLTALALGLPAQVLIKSLSPVFFAHGDTRTPLIATLGGVAIALIAGLLLQPHWDAVGVALAIALAAWGGLAWLALRAKRAYGLGLDAATGGQVTRIAAAALLMAAVLRLIAEMAFPLSDFSALAGATAALIIAAIGLYGLLLVAFGALKWRDLRAALRR